MNEGRKEMSSGQKETPTRDVMAEQLAFIREGKWDETIGYLRAAADENNQTVSSNDVKALMAMISLDKLKIRLVKSTGDSSAKQLLLMLLDLSDKNTTIMKKPKRFDIKHTKRRQNKEVLLHAALKHNAPVDTIVKIVEIEGRGVVLEKDSDSGENALQVALRARPSLDVILKIIDMGGRDVVMERDDNGWNSFHFACKFKAPVEMKLIDIGGKELVLSKDVRGQTSWQIACQHNVSAEVLIKLIEVGRRDLVIKKSSSRSWSPLHVACRSSSASIDVVTKLIEIGGRNLVLQQFVYGGSMNSFHLACKNESPNEEILLKLIEVGGTDLIMQKDSRGEHSLHYAAYYKVPDAVILKLIEIGGRDFVVEKTCRGISALHIASEKKCSFAVVSKLIEVGGKEFVLEKASHGQNSLQIACQNNASFDVVMKLIEIGGRDLVLDTDRWGYNCLHYISALRCTRGNTNNRTATTAIVLKLIEIGGAKLLLHRNNKDLSPLHCLVSERLFIQRGANRVEIMVLLICRGIDYQIGGEFSIGGLFHSLSDKIKKSIYSKWRDIVLPALEHVATRRDNEQLPILHAAIIHKAPLPIIKDIIENFDCIGIIDSMGRYPVDVAVEYEYAWDSGMKKIAEATALAREVSIINVCAKHGLPWRKGMKNVLETSDIEDFERKDRETGLYLFMLAAAAKYNYDLATTFQLIMMSPGQVKLYGAHSR